LRRGSDTEGNPTRNRKKNGLGHMNNKRKKKVRSKKKKKRMALELSGPYWRVRRGQLVVDYHVETKKSCFMRCWSLNPGPHSY
jgi:hypothetical protein